MRKTGIVRRTFGFERAAKRVLAVLVFGESSEVSDDSASGEGTWWGLCGDFGGSGIKTKRMRHRMTDPSARPQGIQGDMLVVIYAVKEAMSSAT
jgi:hypothetical protein